MSGPDRDELRSALAHDLKSPLSVIVGYAELLRLRPDDERTHREGPLFILEAAQRLSTEIDGLVGRLAGGGWPRMEPLASQPRGLERRPEAEGDGRTHRILLVDDDEQLRRLLRLTFPLGEFEILEAADGGQALEIVERERPDLVVLDWKLPVRSGAEVLAELSGRADRPAVVVLTAFGEANPVGADAFLLKPFSPVQLLDVIERLVWADA